MHCICTKNFHSGHGMTQLDVCDREIIQQKGGTTRSVRRWRWMGLSMGRERESYPRARLRTRCLGVDNIYVANPLRCPPRFLFQEIPPSRLRPVSFLQLGRNGKNHLKPEPPAIQFLWRLLN